MDTVEQECCEQQGIPALLPEGEHGCRQHQRQYPLDRIVLMPVDGGKEVGGHKQTKTKNGRLWHILYAKRATAKVKKQDERDDQQEGNQAKRGDRQFPVKDPRKKNKEIPILRVDLCRRRFRVAESFGCIDTFP